MKNIPGAAACAVCGSANVLVLASTSAGVGLNRVWTKPQFSLFRRNCQVQLSIMDCLIKLDCSGWLWSCLWVHVPQIKVRSWTPLFHIRGRLLIWWRWAVVPPIEGEVELQPGDNVLDEEGEF